MSDIERIAKLLSEPRPETQVAAAIVLGELGTRNPKAVEALTRLATGGEKALQVPALEALARIGAPKVFARLLPLLAEATGEVRRAAGRALAAMGEEVVPQIQARLPEAGAEERRILDEVLAQIGGKDAFSAILDGLLHEEAELGRSAALAVRARVREADAKERRSYLGQARKFLGSKKAEGSPAATAAALKILGFLEDPQAVSDLITFAEDEGQPPVVRREALTALRFVLGRMKPAEARAYAPRLLTLVADAEAGVSRTARDTLAFLPLGRDDVPRLGVLTEHEDLDRARFAIAILGRLEDPAATDALVRVMTRGRRRTAEAASETVAGREDAVAPLAKALAAEKDPDRAWQLARVLRAQASLVDPKVRKKLLATAVERLVSGAGGWEAPLDVAREADPKAAALALREAAEGLRKARKPDAEQQVLEVLCRGEQATDEDRFRLASLALRSGNRDVHPAARAKDEALRVLETLSSRGFDVGAALRRDRGLDEAARFYVGFHFVEEGHPLGQELLGELAKGGRTKLAKAARNKLALAAKD